MLGEFRLSGTPAAAFPLNSVRLPRAELVFSLQSLIGGTKRSSSSQHGGPISLSFARVHHTVSMVPIFESLAMSELVSRLFSVESRTKPSRHGNGIAVFCAIVTVVTCCYSSIMAHSNDGIDTRVQQREGKLHVVQPSGQR